MTDDHDEPLDGDIGPAPSAAGVPAVADAAGRAEELRRYEREREERRRRTDAVSGRVALVAVALLLAFLAYDSVTTAVVARRRGDPWIYPPAVVAGICLVSLATLVTWTIVTRRRRRR